MAHTIKPVLLSRNFAEGRGGRRPVDLVVVHVTEGDADSVLSWFNNPKANVSAHYLVRTNGKILQFVAETDTAWHAGRVDHPTARLVVERVGENPNDFSIGIEHEGDGTQELTQAQRIASISLIADICGRHSIPIDRDHIVGHHEIYSLKTCPGAINVERLVAATLAYSGTPAPPSATPPLSDDRPRVVWSPQLNDYLVVTQYVSDEEWYYARLSDLATQSGTRAGSLLSHMPLQPK